MGPGFALPPRLARPVPRPSGPGHHWAGARLPVGPAEEAEPSWALTLACGETVEVRGQERDGAVLIVSRRRIRLTRREAERLSLALWDRST